MLLMWVLVGTCICVTYAVDSQKVCNHFWVNLNAQWLIKTPVFYHRSPELP